MSDKARVFVDTNVLVYLLSGDAEKAQLAEHVLTRTDIERVISVQILSEFTSVARRKSGLDWDAIAEFHELFRDTCAVVDLRDTDIDEAMIIADRYGFSWYDCLVLASAGRAHTDMLLSEDLQNLQRVGSLSVVNPFSDARH